MSETPNPRRRYGDKEVGLLLKRATELQKNDPEPSEGGGLTLAELQEIAGEAGIDPRFLQAAAYELDTVGPTAEGVEKWLGGPVEVELERTVPGDVPSDGFDMFIDAIRRTAGDRGQPDVIGRTLIWTLPNRSRQLQVTVRSRDGETEIRIEERMQQLILEFYAGIVTAGGIVAAGVLGLGLGLGAPLVWAVLAAVLPIVGAFGLARHFFGKISGKRRKNLTRLIDELTELVEAVAPPPKRVEGGG